MQNAVPSDGLTVAPSQTSNLELEIAKALDLASEHTESPAALAKIARATVLWHIEHAPPGALDPGLAQAWQDRAERCIRNAEQLVAKRRADLAAVGEKQASVPFDPSPEGQRKALVELGRVLCEKKCETCHCVLAAGEKGTCLTCQHNAVQLAGLATFRKSFGDGKAVKP